MGLNLAAFACLMALAGIATPARAAGLTEVTDFGGNPSGAKMYVYVPEKLSAKPAIIVACHACQNTAQSTYSGTPYARLADQKGYLLIYPQSPYSGTCWDVSSKASLTHNGGGNSNSIANMVTYAISKYQADESKVFLVGMSSGAMMAVSISYLFNPITRPN